MKDIEIIHKIENEIGQSFEYETDENQNVISINLSEKGLKKIPDALSEFKFLKTLDIRKNNFDIQIKGLSEIVTLKQIDISNNTPKLWLHSKEIEDLFLNSNELETFNFRGNLPANTLPEWVIDKDFHINCPFEDSNFGLSIDFDAFAWFPPQELLCIGYNHTKYFRDKEIFPNVYKMKNTDIISNWKSDVDEKFIDKHIRTHNANQTDGPLKFRLEQLKILKFYGISEIHLAGIQNDAQWIFFTGENGYGKSAILQALVISMFGNEDNGKILDSKQNIGVFSELFSGTDSIVNIQVGLSGKRRYSYFKDNQNFTNFAAYGASRLNKSEKPQNSSRTYNLFNTDGYLLDIEQKMIEWEKDEIQSKYHNAAKQILIELLSPQVEDIIILRKGSETFVKYKEFQNDDLRSFEELATGYRSIIAMIGDMMIRLAETQPEISDFKELAGIVIIDEFDIYLHPKWQKELVKKLSDLFPHIQFIVSTHSPIPLLGAPKNSIVIKVDRDKEHGITSEKLDIDFTTLTPNSILTSPIFGFENLVSVSKSEDKNLNTEDYFNDIIEKDKSLKEISEYLDEDKTKRIIELLNS